MSSYNVEENKDLVGSLLKSTAGGEFKKPVYIKTDIKLKVYAPEKFERIIKLDGFTLSDIKKALAETKNRE